MFFEGFTIEFQEAAGKRFRLRRGGEGPPLLLLHGNPQTHAMWHRVAPVLAKRFTVICPDLTGYGFSAKPAVSEDHAPYAKRAMAADLVALMQAFGYARFQVVAHDRGARVAHRMALDHADTVEQLCTMDIIPTLEHFERVDMAFAMGYWHWFFLAQRHPGPEAMIRADIVPWFDFHTSREPKPADFFHPDARADYLAALHEPGTIEAICEDYRAATAIDLVHDRASRDSRQTVRCPMLALWGAKGSIPKWYDAAEIWQRYASGPLTTGEVPSGHYLAEEAPEAVLTHLDGFLRR